MGKYRTRVIDQLQKYRTVAEQLPRAHPTESLEATSISSSRHFDSKGADIMTQSRSQSKSFRGTDSVMLYTALLPRDGSLPSARLDDRHRVPTQGAITIP